jgi:hypothetical protein
MAQLFDPKGVGDYTRRALQRLKEYVDAREAATLGVMPNVNMFINGDFRFNQRNVVSATTSLSYPADRWWMNVGGGTLTCSRQLFTAGTVVGGQSPRDYVRCVTTGYSGTPGAADNALLCQNVEDVNITAGRLCTVSFYARAASGTPRVSVETTSNYGVGGSPEEPKLVGTVNLSTTWTRYSLTFTPPSTSGKVLGGADTSSLRFNFWMTAGTDFAARLGSAFTENNTFEFWGMQFELGAVATPFVSRPWQEELALCQRYFQRVQPAARGVWAGASTFSRVGFPLVPPMRIGPTCSHSGNFNVWDGNAGLVGPLSSVSFPSPQPAYVEVDGLIASAVMTTGRPAIFYLPHAGWFDCSAEYV